ncbi:hypothetical protein C8Q76DRAFT_117589 [Earliella scabrosa]|nr:hypothetical protein C8Q76DRAFT_117589 [Earliella scabrosa]
MAPVTTAFVQIAPFNPLRSHSPTVKLPPTLDQSQHTPRTEMAAQYPLADIVSSVKEGLACNVIGGILGTTVYGITILQTYIYYRGYMKDTAVLKTLVGVLFILDSLTSFLIAHGIYKYLVIDFMTPIDNFLHFPHTLVIENGVTTTIGTLTQCFFAQRIYYLSRNKVLAGVIALLSVGAFGSGIALTVHMFIDQDIFSLGSDVIRALAGFTNGLSVFCDTLIAVSLCYYLRSGKSGFRRTNDMVDRLMVYAIQRGTITALCQAGHLITTIAYPGHFYMMPFAFMQGKLYCNTLLASLNVRNSVIHSGRQDDMLHAGSIVLSGVQRDTSSRHIQLLGAAGSRGTGTSATLEFNAPRSKDETSIIVIDHDIETGNARKACSGREDSSS